MAGDDEHDAEMEHMEALEQLQKRTAQGAVQFGEIGKSALSGGDMKAAGIAAGNISVLGPDAETMKLSETSRAARERNAEAMERIQERRRMAEVVVPALDPDVRKLLRRLGEPVTLFGEREMERRDRLRKLLAGMDDDQREQVTGQLAREAAILEERKVLQTETFYTEGPAELEEARRRITVTSLARARDRVARQRAMTDADYLAVDERQARAGRMLRALAQESSQVVGERPVSACQFLPGGEALAVASWSGKLKVVSVPDFKTHLTVAAHEDRVTGLAVLPGAAPPGDAGSGAAHYVTGSADGTARVFSGAGALLRTLAGHGDRLGRVAVHPDGGHCATASFDRTWRLWDLETGACLAEQEGHSRAVYAVAFQGDGSLVASAGMDCAPRVWDVRSGRCVVNLEGHVGGVLALDFSPSGYQLASGALDHSARVWDLRRRQCLATLPGHTSLVSTVRFEPTHGDYLLTAGYDGSTKLWSGYDFTLLKSLRITEGKVMAADICPGGGEPLVATGSYDRSVKLWKRGILDVDAGDGSGGGDVAMA